MKKVLKTVANILSWIVLAIALLVTILVFSSGANNGVANLFGFMPLTIESDSMVPTFKQGDLIICREVDDVMQLQKGDVITFWTIIDGVKVKNTHRIDEIQDNGTTRSFITRGDNNPVADETPVYANDIIGQWTNVRLGGLGTAMNFLRTKTGFFICILIPMAIFFLFELYKFIVTLIEVKSEKTTELDEEEIKRRAIEEYLASQKEKEAASAETPEQPDSTDQDTPDDGDPA